MDFRENDPVEENNEDVEQVQGTLLDFDRDAEFRNKREKTRTLLAVAMIGLIGLIILGIYFGVAFLEWSTDTAETISMIILNPIMAIFGTIIGFYFASSQG